MWLLMFIVTLYALGNPNGWIMCNSSYNLVEDNVKMGFKRITAELEFFQAAAAAAQDMGNIRNTLSFDVTRAQDFIGNPFQDPEAAYRFAIEQTIPAQYATRPGNSLPGSGYLQIQMAGQYTSSILYLSNVVLPSINVVGWKGIAATFNYTFSGGLYLPTVPTT